MISSSLVNLILNFKKIFLFFRITQSSLHKRNKERPRCCFTNNLRAVFEKKKYENTFRNLVTFISFLLRLNIRRVPWNGHFTEQTCCSFGTMIEIIRQVLFYRHILNRSLQDKFDWQVTTPFLSLVLWHERCRPLFFVFITLYYEYFSINLLVSPWWLLRWTRRLLW